MADTAPDVDRALWTVVSQIVKLYDDEPIAQEWLAEANATGKLHRAGVALAVWYKAQWPLTRNDETHYAGYYTHQETSTAEGLSAVLQRLDYDSENRATNFAEIRDRLDDPALLGPYFFLQRIIPLLNDKGITLQISEILNALSLWLNHDQIVWLVEDADKPGWVAVYSTEMDAQLTPAEQVMTLQCQTLVAALRLFLPTAVCEHIQRNGDGHQHFIAVLVPQQAVVNNLRHEL